MVCGGDCRLRLLSINRCPFLIMQKKSILICTKQKLSIAGSLDIRYCTTQIKQYHKVTHVGCSLDKNLSGKLMAFKIFQKINSIL